MVPKFSHEQAERVLARLDKVAKAIQDNHKAWGLDFRIAKQLVNEIDKTADEIEAGTLGEESFVLRQAEVLGMDSDEAYMKTFSNPMQPHQVESDEKYMSAFKDDQSSAVHSGKSTTGRPLAP